MDWTMAEVKDFIERAEAQRFSKSARGRLVPAL